MCKICKNKTKRIYDKQLKYYYEKCDICGFIYRLEEFHYDKSKEYDHYNKHNNTLEETGYVNMMKSFINDAVKPFIKKGNALDYGCGPGPVLAYLLKENGFNTKIYDLYFNHDLDYDKYKYDLITSTEVFEHFKNPIKEIEKIISLLKTNAYLSIMTYFIPDDFLNWWYRRDYTHISFYTIDTFKYLANKYNLKIVYTNNKNIITFKRLQNL